MADGGDLAHHVGRAASAAVPLRARDAAATEQRIDVEVALSIQRDAAQEAVVERAFEHVGVARIARCQEHAPVPHHPRDGGAGLAVALVAGQLVGIAERLAGVARAVPADEVHLLGRRAVPEPLLRVHQRLFAGLDVGIGDAGGQVELADGVAGHFRHLAHGDVVLVVLRAPATVAAHPALAALVDEELRQVEVALLAGLAVEFHQRQLRSPGWPGTPSRLPGPKTPSMQSAKRQAMSSSDVLPVAR